LASFPLSIWSGCGGKNEKRGREKGRKGHGVQVGGSLPSDLVFPAVSQTGDATGEWGKRGGEKFNLEEGEKGGKIFIRLAHSFSCLILLCFDRVRREGGGGGGGPREKKKEEEERVQPTRAVCRP